MRIQFVRFFYLPFLLFTAIYPQDNPIEHRLILTANICDIDEESLFE